MSLSSILALSLLTEEEHLCELVAAPRPPIAVNIVSLPRTLLESLTELIHVAQYSVEFLLRFCRAAAGVGQVPPHRRQR